MERLLLIRFILLTHSKTYKMQRNTDCAVFFVIYFVERQRRNISHDYIRLCKSLRSIIRRRPGAQSERGAASLLLCTFALEHRTSISDNSREKKRTRKKEKAMQLGYACINMSLSDVPKSRRITTNRSMIKRTFQAKGLSYV